MYDTKSWYASKAVWGGIVAIVGALSNMVMKGQFAPEDIMAAVGGVMAIYGRIVATKVIVPKS